MRPINTMAEKDACIDEVTKIAYSIAMPDDPRFKFLNLIQMTNKELAKARCDVLVEQINWCYKRLGYLASE